MPTTVGKKNGEIKCFKDGPTVLAFSWNADSRTWDKIGEVVGQQEEKKFYAGDEVFPRGEYDFVWDVDMGPALGMRKLPYNKGSNPMVVAEAFCNREQIHKSNLDQIRQFIMQNSGEGHVAVPQAAPPAPAPAPVPPPETATAAESTVFPLLQPISVRAGK